MLSDPTICQRHSANKGFTIWVSEFVHERYNITLTVNSCRYQRSQQFCIQLKVYNCLTLRASLSGTFLQTLPDLVTPLKAALGTLYLRAAVHRRGQRPPKGLGTDHTPSIAFRHHPPNSARPSDATKGALFFSAQLSTDAVSALRKV